MLFEEYEDMQSNLLAALKDRNFTTNRIDSYNDGILAAKSILKRFSLIYGFDQAFNRDEYVILKKAFSYKLKSGRGRYDAEYNEAIEASTEILRKFMEKKR